MEVISEMIEGKNALTRVVGIGSKWHVEELDSGLKSQKTVTSKLIIFI